MESNINFKSKNNRFTTRIAFEIFRIIERLNLDLHENKEDISCQSW